MRPRPIPGFASTAQARPGYVTMGQAQKFLPISYRRLKELVDAGEIRSLRNGQARLIPVAELTAYEERLLAQSAYRVRL